MSTDMTQIFSEFIGMTVLILLGDGVCAAVNLNKSKAQNSGWIVIAFGWALAVTVGVYIAGLNGPAHLNPAVTVAMAVNGSFEAHLVLPFIIAQLLGAIVGATLVWLAYLPHWEAPQIKVQFWVLLQQDQRFVTIQLILSLKRLVRFYLF